MKTDFDFLFGSWNVKNRYLVGRLRGSSEWMEFDATCRAWPLLDGGGNVDSFAAIRDGHAVHGATFRLYTPATDEWAIHWADTIRPGVLCPPMVGRFDGKVGTFFGEEEVDDRKVLCRFLWTRGGAPRWEQAFSGDGGQTWETNWIMDFSRS
jgi:hypothetical protein